MNNIIGFFEYNNTKFVITLNNGGNILFLKENKIKGDFESKLGKEDIKVVNTVYNSLLINKKDSKLIEQLDLNDHKYDIFYDIKTNNYYWISENNIFYDKDNVILNFKYNHEPEMIYNNKKYNENKLNNNFYNKFIKIGNKLIKLMLVASLSLYTLTGCTIQNNTFSFQDNSSETTLIESIDDKKTISYNWETLKEIIKNNPNLAEKDKEIIYKLKFVFDENHQYMDLDLVYDRLSNLKILHNAKTNIFNADGAYNFGENTIELYTDRLDIYIHEFLHVLQDCGGGFMKELSNEFFAREILIRLYKENLLDKEIFLSNYCLEEKKKGNIKLETEADWLKYINIGKGYQTHIGIYYILADILPAEILRKYQFNPDSYDILIDALDKITYQYDETYMIGMGYKLLGMINNIGYSYYNGDLIDYNIMQEKNNQLNETLDYYYRTIKGIGFTDNLYFSMMFGMNYSILQSGEYYDFIMKKYNLKLSYYDVKMIPKTYLSESQKNPLCVCSNDENPSRIIELDSKVVEEFYQFSLKKNKTK